MNKRVRSPSEKKRLSYERDGRNTRAESKSSRNAIPNFKARSNRAMRHGVGQNLKSIAIASDVETDRIDTRVAEATHKGLHPVKTKEPDEPLGAVLASKKKLPTKSALTAKSKARMTRYRFKKLTQMDAG